MSHLAGRSLPLEVMGDPGVAPQTPSAVRISAWNPSGVGLAPWWPTWKQGRTSSTDCCDGSTACWTRRGPLPLRRRAVVGRAASGIASRS